MKHSVRIATSFFLATLIGSAIFGLFAVSTEDKNLTKYVTENLHLAATVYANTVRIYTSEQQDKILLFSDNNYLQVPVENSNSPLSTDHQKSLNEKLTRIAKADDDIEEASIVNKSDSIIASSNPHFIGKYTLNPHTDSESTRQVHISDIHYSENLHKQVIDFYTPIFGGGKGTSKSIGGFIVTIPLEKLAKITMIKKSLAHFEDVYMVDQKSSLLTPSKYLQGQNRGVLTQKVDTKNIRDCLDAYTKHFDPFIAKMKGHSPHSEIYIDFRGEKVLGTHAHILNPQWCLVVEGSYERLIGDVLKDFIKKYIIFSSIIIVSVTLLSFAARKTLGEIL